MIPNKAIGTPHAAAVAILLFKVSPKNLKYGVVSVPPPIPSKVLTEPVKKAKVLRNLYLLFSFIVTSFLYDSVVVII
tara:strand:- start:66 stop:296 length:231 start_codon:yes stop_codon:yes gene_type:complete